MQNPTRAKEKLKGRSTITRREAISLFNDAGFIVKNDRVYTSDGVHPVALPSSKRNTRKDIPVGEIKNILRKFGKS